MGNWRTVHITGTCAAEEVPALRDRLAIDYMDPDPERYKLVGCLHNGGICSLPNWAGESFDYVGNLHERDYSPEDVAEEVRRLKDDVAPSLLVRVDCGGDYESDECVATVLVGEDGTVAVIDPMVDTIPAIPAGQMQESLLRQLMR